ncbi:cell wall metabolism sensor histidine kinase WalK [Marmoricola sp. URHB0036]|uniref:sensor histidine kinase n=1 Tax=Marmoricola sp. URHB0036 TaxID=1298863 RepID=UPI00041F5A75|nr:HAMP domain-containing sensor histidine kinase [Marmoricola sp. URHB0036]
MRLPRSLTSRLVITTVVLVAVTSVLIGTVTALAMRSYLYSRLDDQVMKSFDLGRPPGGDIGPGPDLGAQLRTVTGLYPEEGPAQAFVVTTRDDNRGVKRSVSTTVTEQLDKVPTDGALHTVNLTALGDYRVIARDVTGGKIVTGLPTTEVHDILSSLIWLEVLLGLLGVVAAGGAGTLVVRRQLRPLNDVAQTAHAVAVLPLDSGDIGVTERVPERLTDERTEVGQVGAALNTLLEHVEVSLTARHRSEQQVRQFVADASHELRTPLATIHGYAELSRRTPDDPAALASALTKVETETDRMSTLVDDLLLLARLDSGRPLDRVEVDVTRLLLESVGDARVLAPGHRWQLRLPEEPVTVTGDEQRLHQVVTNLLSNARHHTPPGTTVTVSAEPSDSGITITVHDDGPGLPPGLADHVFERFTRGDSSRTRASGGAGLGLSLVAAIVQAHAGSTSVRSEPGDTTFTVTLPA